MFLQCVSGGLATLNQMKRIFQACTTFIERHNNHSNSFNHEKYENETELSKYVWKLKKNSKISITWKMMSHVTTKRRPLYQCNLCLEEKYKILKQRKNPLSINKQTI